MNLEALLKQHWSADDTDEVRVPLKWLRQLARQITKTEKEPKKAKPPKSKNISSGSTMVTKEQKDRIMEVIAKGHHDMPSLKRLAGCTNHEVRAAARDLVKEGFLTKAGGNPYNVVPAIPEQPEAQPEVKPDIQPADHAVNASSDNGVDQVHAT